MLDALKFVKGAIVKNAVTDASTHYHITNGRIKSFNGVISLCSPIELDIAASPEATTFLKAIEACEDTTSIHLTKAGRLSIKSGDFKAFIKCIKLELPFLEPEGETVQLDGELLPVVKKLIPFVSTSDAKQWARGMLFSGQSAFATNNACLIEHWLPYAFPVDVNVPLEALMELVRIGEEPKSLQITDRSLTFVYEDDKWLKTSLHSTQWPDMASILDGDSKQIALHDCFFDDIKKLLPFVSDNKAVLLDGEKLCTSRDSDEDGASVVVAPVFGNGAYSAKQLLLLQNVADTIDLTLSPAPCLFYGDNIRGAIMGMRV